ncbi:hypothetical protein T12_2428 [Trichinella patagoniensis]|uniref:Uncharacterized protein n=1 Tax=Trichinella patagoniensis TaxID=990121 RepID=A0A0V0YRU5_9BILA|nr:hypothetical protein T12_2428 [Trichinella patagoniensis]
MQGLGEICPLNGRCIFSQVSLLGYMFLCIFDNFTF